MIKLLYPQRKRCSLRSGDAAKMPGCRHHLENLHATYDFERSMTQKSVYSLYLLLTNGDSGLTDIATVEAGCADVLLVV